MSDQDLSKMKVADLRQALKSKGFSIVGNKQELIERLQSAMSDSCDLEDSKLLEHDEDELLNDDELEKSLLDSTHDEIILQSPSESTKSTSPEANVAPVKKVSLKRNISVNIPVIEPNESKNDDTEITLTTSAANLSEPEKKVIKISELTAKDRLELRAKKFGNDGTSTERKEARAARFGTAKSPETPSKANSATSIDLLKKRAERFGAAINPEVKKAEIEEKLQKRQDRFGSTVKTPITGPSTVSGNADYAEKARLRLERFNKQAA